MTTQEIKTQLCDVYLEIEGTQVHLQQCLQQKQMLVGQLQQELAKEAAEKAEKEAAERKAAEETKQEKIGDCVVTPLTDTESKTTA